MNEHGDILETIRLYLNAVYIEKDIGKAKNYLDDDVISCEINTSAVLSSRQKLIDHLENFSDKIVKNHSLRIENEVIHVYDKMAVFNGRLVLLRDSEVFKSNNCKKRETVLDYSATLRENNGWKICASHNSAKEEYTDESWGFTEDNIAGGLLSAYIEKDSFPLRFANDNLLKLLGYTQEEFREKYAQNALDTVYPDDFEAVQEEVMLCMSENRDWKLRHRVQTKSGAILHMLVRGTKSIDAAGREIVNNFSIDMTDLYLLQEEVAIQAEELSAQNDELSAQQEELEAQNEELSAQTDALIEQTKELLLSEKKFRIALAKTDNIIFNYDILKEIIICYNLEDSAKDRIINIKNLENELIPEQSILDECKLTFWEIFSKINSGEKIAKQDVQTISENGKIKWYHITLTAVDDMQGHPVYAIGTIQDITRQKKDEIKLKYKAECDLLTGVYNKVSVMEKVEEKLTTQDGIRSGIFMIIDIDYFKGINDNYGHPCGDRILKEIAEVLKKNFGDMDIVGRLGGDEFGIYFEESNNIQFIQQKAESIRKDIKEIHHPGGTDRKVSVSIGISSCNGMKKDFEQIYKEADEALYCVKQRGKDGFHLYSK